MASLAGAQSSLEPLESDVDLSKVKKIEPNTALTAIAIPTFDTSGPTGGLQTGFFREIIYKDLVWLSDFERVNNQQFIEEAHAQDKRKGNIEYTEWQRLNAHVVLKGSYIISGKKITVECQLYDVVYGTRIFNLRYSDRELSKARQLAHRISDDIVRNVFKDEMLGIANTRIAFVSQVPGSKHKEIYLIDADGYNMKQLTNDKSTALTPCWGKNGTEVYYTSYKDYNPDLCGIQLGSDTSWFISRRPQMNYSAAWSPKAERIALALGKDGNDEIYTMERSGRNATLKRLTFTPGNVSDISPSWSPGGNRIVFSSNFTGTLQIHVMNADGTNQKILTKRGRENAEPVWSPRGDRIAFQGKVDGTFEIFTMDLEGKDWQRLTSRQGQNESPSWAPDGQHIIFSSNRTGQYQLYIMRSDGSNQHQLTFRGLNESPAWGPSPY